MASLIGLGRRTAATTTRIIPHQRGFPADANPLDTQTPERSGLDVQASVQLRGDDAVLGLVANGTP